MSGKREAVFGVTFLPLKKRKGEISHALDTVCVTVPTHERYLLHARIAHQRDDLQPELRFDF